MAIFFVLVCVNVDIDDELNRAAEDSPSFAATKVVAEGETTNVVSY